MTAEKSRSLAPCLARQERGGEATNEVARGVTAAEVARRTCFAARRIPYSGQRSSSRQLSFQAVELRLLWREQSQALVERIESKSKHAARREEFRGQAGSARARGSRVGGLATPNSRAWPSWRRAILNELGKAKRMGFQPKSAATLSVGGRAGRQHN